MGRGKVRLLEQLHCVVQLPCLLQQLGQPAGYIVTIKQVLTSFSPCSESDLFNKLESIATSAQPTTPVLGCIISKALETQYTHNSVSCSGPLALRPVMNCVHFFVLVSHEY